MTSPRGNSLFSRDSKRENNVCLIKLVRFNAVRRENSQYKSPLPCTTDKESSISLSVLGRRIDCGDYKLAKVINRRLTLPAKPGDICAFSSLVTRQNWGVIAIMADDTSEIHAEHAINQSASFSIFIQRLGIFDTHPLLPYERIILIVAHCLWKGATPLRRQSATMSRANSVPCASHLAQGHSRYCSLGRWRLHFFAFDQRIGEPLT